MKYLKILGLAAVAAMAVMAFVGAGTASATVVCKTTASPCGSQASELEATLTKGGTASLQAEGITLDTCTEGKVKGSITSQGATVTASGPVSAANLTWGNCTQTTTTNEGGTLEVHSISGTENGTVTAKGFVVTVNTIFGSCTYGFGTTAKDLGTLVGGAPATLAIEASVPRISGPCPATATWKANYTVTSPNPLYILAS